MKRLLLLLPFFLIGIGGVVVLKTRSLDKKQSQSTSPNIQIAYDDLTLKSEQNISEVMASPQVLIANTSTALTITARVGGHLNSLIPSTVTLGQYSSNDSLTVNHGKMFDDGSHGDRLAGDGIFTSQVMINAGSSTEIVLRVAASYHRALRRVVSQPLVLPVFSVSDSSLLALNDIISGLESGDISKVMSRISETSRQKIIIGTLTADERIGFAAFLKNATRSSSDGLVDIYANDSDQIIFVRDINGKWMLQRW
jgi:hypothetical protein